MRSTKLIILLALVFAVFAITASADTINVQTNVTKGCFGANCGTNPSNLKTSTDHNGLQFTGTSFTGTVQNGSDILLGEFSLSTLFADFYNHDFSALISFIVPTGAGNTLVTADLEGSVFFGAGGVEIDWKKSLIPIAFNGGTFNLFLEDLYIPNGFCGDVDWTAEVRDLKVVPEPATMLLLGSGLLMGGIGRKFRLAKKS